MERLSVEFAPGTRVVRVATGDYGVVSAADGEYCEVVFANAGQATIHVDGHDQHFEGIESIERACSIAETYLKSGRDRVILLKETL